MSEHEHHWQVAFAWSDEEKDGDVEVCIRKPKCEAIRFQAWNFDSTPMVYVPEAEIASLRTQVETLNGWKEGALLGSAEMRKEVAFWRERAEAAERELDELEAWRRGLTEERFVKPTPPKRKLERQVRHKQDLRDPWRGWHFVGEPLEPCPVVYPDGTTECAWLEAHKEPEEAQR